MLIRAARPGDELAVARIHVSAWQAAYRGLLPQGYLDRLRAEERAQKYQFGSDDRTRPKTLVALESEAIVGFATVAPARDPDAADQGELCALYVDPELWGRGIGAALIAAARAELVESGFRKAMLWVLAGNDRAQRFYGRDGWSADGRHRNAVIWGVAADEVCYRRALGAD